MNVILFGATGMVGQGVLLECLDDPAIARVVSVVGRANRPTHPKQTPKGAPHLHDRFDARVEVLVAERGNRP